MSLNFNDVPDNSDQRALAVIETPMVSQNLFGNTAPIESGCKNNYSPNEVYQIKIYPAAIKASVPENLVSDATKETIAHEIGHAIHICHHKINNNTLNQTDCDVCCPDPATCNNCSNEFCSVPAKDGATGLEGCNNIPSPGSVMRQWLWLNCSSYPVNEVYKHYSQKDKDQIRLHIKH